MKVDCQKDIVRRDGMSAAIGKYDDDDGGEEDECHKTGMNGDRHGRK